MALSRGRYWTGWVISTLLSLMFLMSAGMKLKGGPEVAAGMEHLGIASVARNLRVLVPPGPERFRLPRTTARQSPASPGGSS